MSWYVYIVRCSDDSLYAGVSEDIARRINEHNSVKKKAAKYTWSRRPVKLVWQTQVSSRSEALSLERKIKSLSRAEKLKMISEEVYIIVCHGYEGTEKLFHGSTDKDAIKEKFTELGKIIAAVNEERLRLDKDLGLDADYSDEAIDEYHRQMESRFGKDYSLYTYLEASRLCIQKGNLVNEFRCCCSELGVSPSETIYY